MKKAVTQTTMFEEYESLMKTLRCAQKTLNAHPPKDIADSAQKRIDDANARLREVLREIEAGIDALTDEKVAGLMRMRYLCGMCNEDVSIEAHYDYDYVRSMLRLGKREIAQYIQEKPP